MPKLNIKEAEVMDLYIARLVADKGLREEDRKQHGKISHQVQLEFEEACQKALIQALPDAKAIELNQKLQADPDFSDAQIEQFFSEAVANPEQIIIETMTKFRADYLGETAAKQQSDVAALVANGTTLAQSAETKPVAEATAPAKQDSATTADQPATVAASTVPTNMTSAQNITTEPPAGNPTQGTTSEVQGASDVEGVATAAAAQLDGVNISSEMPAMQSNAAAAVSASNNVNAMPIQPQSNIVKPDIAEISQNPVITTEENR